MWTVFKQCGPSSYNSEYFIICLCLLRCLFVWALSLLVSLYLTPLFGSLWQLFGSEASVFRLKFKQYIFDFWNILDVITILTFFIGIILKLVPQESCKDCLEASRIMLALNLMMFYFRMLDIFSVHKELGPKLVMIGRMVS